ncbi:MAG: glycosyltransferase family 39 protein, partial [Anaerolineae bacterium]|nr:glycosyltransferase family 39 protein [Anaerolineae bacterium]
VIFLTKTPPVFIDESWNANTAWNWLQTGNNFDSMHSGTLDQFGYEWLRWPKIGNIPWRVSFATLGLGLFQARIVSWIFACLLLIATILTARKTYGILTGILAALILSLSTPFLQASHYARWDIMLPTIAMFAYWLSIKGLKENKWWCHLLAGLLIGLSIDIHQNAVLFMLGFAVLYLAFFGKAFFKSQGTWLFGLGAVLGIGYFVATFILPNPDAYFNLFSLSLGNTHRIPITTLNPLHILQSIDDEIGRYHFFENSLEFALLGASLIYLAYRRNKYDRYLLSFISAVFAGFVLFIGNKHDVYAILLYPFFMLLVAETMVSLIRDGKASSPQRLFASSLVLLFLVSSGIHYAREVFSSRNYNYYAIMDEIKPYIPPDSRVMGLPNWWLGLAEYDYRSSLNLTYYHFLNDYTLTEGFNEIKPDVLILDRDLQALLVDQEAYKSNAGFQIYQLPRQEFEAVLEERGELVHGFWDPWHGWFDIYILHWDEDI